MVIVWICASFSYYLISYQMKYFHGDMYINSFASSSSEIAGIALSGKMFNKLGIKMSLLISYNLSLCGMLCLLFIPTENKALLATFVLLGKFGISASFNIAYIGNYYLFPSSIVATSFGICNIFARMSSIGSPFVAELPGNISKIVFVSVVGLAIFVSFAIVDKKRKGTKSKV